MTRTFIARLPIFACAGFIAFLFLANLWNFAVERDWPKLRIRSASPLAGVAKPKPAPWTLDAFLSGETQKAVSINLGRASPVFPIAVRAKNQLVYSLFGGSGAPGVVIGRNGQLYEQSISTNFARAAARRILTRINAWASTLRARSRTRRRRAARVSSISSRPRKPRAIRKICRLPPHARRARRRCPTSSRPILLR